MQEPLLILGISLWDWGALLAYIIGITLVGIWTSKRIHDTADFYMAGRKTNRLLMVFFAFGVGTSGNDAVGVSSRTYTDGMAGIWYQWLWLFATPFYWIIAPFFRRMRALTTGDFFEYRYNSSVAGLYSIVGVSQLTLNIGVLFLGAGAMTEAITQGAIPRGATIAIMAAATLIIGIAGGLTAAILTDLIQGILTVILSFILLPFALHQVGYMSGMRRIIDNPGMFSLVSPGEINLFHIIMFAVLALIGIVTQPHMMGVAAAGRNEMDGRIGMTGGNMLKRVCTIAWMLTGLAGLAMFMDEPIAHPDLVYGEVARVLLPSIAPGLVGVFLAALIASVMSSCDAQMISSSGLFTHNFYRRFLVPGRDERHYLKVGRVTSVVIVGGGLFFANMVPDVPRGLEWFFHFQALMGAAFWLGLFWRGATPAGAWAGTLVAFATLMLTDRAFFHAWASNNLPDFMVWNEQFRLSWRIVSYLTAGFGSAILVSLMTRRVPDARLQRFYDCLRTPISPDEPSSVEPFLLPEGVTPEPASKLIDHPALEIPRPTAAGMIGFIVCWGIVVAMVGFVYWIAGMGD